MKIENGYLIIEPYEYRRIKKEFRIKLERI